MTDASKAIKVDLEEAKTLDLTIAHMVLDLATVSLDFKRHQDLKQEPMSRSPHHHQEQQPRSKDILTQEHLRSDPSRSIRITVRHHLTLLYSMLRHIQDRLQRLLATDTLLNIDHHSHIHLCRDLHQGVLALPHQDFHTRVTLSPQDMASPRHRLQELLTTIPLTHPHQCRHVSIVRRHQQDILHMGSKATKDRFQMPTIQKNLPIEDDGGITEVESRFILRNKAVAMSI